MKTKRAILFFLLLIACESEGQDGEPKVEVGVFFGGQIQRLDRIEVSTVQPPKIGFRLEMPPGAPWRGEVTYEIVRPGPSGRRVTEKGSLSLPDGQSRIDHVLAVEPSHKLGVWNVRVQQGDHLLADRALYLVPPLKPSP